MGKESASSRNSCEYGSNRRRGQWESWAVLQFRQCGGKELHGNVHLFRISPDTTSGYAISLLARGDMDELSLQTHDY